MGFKLTHPNSDLEIERDVDQVEMYRTQGWETKPGANVPDPKTPDGK